jgi:hypothetical protein
MRMMLAAALGALAIFSLWSPVRAQSFDDVPDDHWAYDAIDYLQQAGLVEGYPDGTFRGDRPFTRYEMAMVIARVFTKIQDWQAMNGGDGLPPMEGNAELDEVYARLDRLSDEFRDELSELGARVTAVEDEQTRMRGEMDDLKALIKDSGLSGEARWRAGGFIATGSEDLSNEVGFESYIKLNYLFQPEDNLDFKLSLTSTEIEGPAGTGWAPGDGNETDTGNPATPPFGNRQKSSSFLVDEAHFKYYFCDIPSFFGDCPTLTGGRQYFSEGEYGLAGDNGYRSNFGVRFDTSYGNEIDAHIGYYRTESVARMAPWSNNDPNAFQSSALTREADDLLLAGLEYHSGEGSVPGHDYKLVVRLDGTPNGFGSEQYVGFSGNAEIPYFSDCWVNGIRGEWVYVMNNASNQDPSGDLGLTNYSFIVELDMFNDGRSRVSLAGAQIAQIEGLPVFANVDNDPFSEWDFTVNQTADAFNFSREGRNYFPSDFTGIGLQAEHCFGDKLKGTLTYYNGKRINASASNRPGLAKLRFDYALSNNSSMALDFIAAGERNGLEDPIGMVRGEYKIHF